MKSTTNKYILYYIKISELFLANYIKYDAEKSVMNF